jgi:hypothetical protein|nr:MAG TPA: hypothetical protein [Caudoviricetes sp.]
MWIELNDGELLNLEKVQRIAAQFDCVLYYFSGKERRVEMFKSPLDVETRMEGLKELLK